MAGEDILANPALDIAEQHEGTPEFTLDLKDVPTDSPGAFNDALVDNIGLAVTGLTDYLNANRRIVFDKTFMMDYLKTDKQREEYRVELGDRVDEFIQDVQDASAVLIESLRGHRDEPIEKQKELVHQAAFNFSLNLARHYGTMQSFIPYNLKAGYDAIEDKIDVPLGFALSRRRAAYKPAPRVADVDPDHDSADRILDAL